MGGFRYFQTPDRATQRKPLQPHNIISGGLPGATEIRLGEEGVKISGLDKRITITASDSSTVGIGSIPGDISNFGFFSTDASGNLIQKIILGTWYIYDVNNSNENRMQSGILPDDSIGWAVAKVGSQVEDIFTP